MAKTVRMTTAQAIVKFLDNQYVSMDGVETKFVEGFFTIFGHGIAVGLGEALDTNPGQLKVLQGFELFFHLIVVSRVEINGNSSKEYQIHWSGFIKFDILHDLTSVCLMVYFLLLFCVLWGMPLEIFAVNISENSDNEPMRN